MVKKVCEVCGKTFITYPSRIKKGQGRFCSKECFSKSIVKKVKRICKYCGKEFETFPSRLKKGVGIYCSKECHFNAKFGVSRTVLKKCLYCGSVYRIPHSRKSKSKYCSNECRYKHYSELFKGPNNPTWNHVSAKCEYCGKEFNVPEHDAKRLKYCSKECAGKSQRKRVKKICLNCGKEFFVKESVDNYGRGIYCSKRCKHKHHSIRYSGEKSPHWKGGTSFGAYCEKFNNEFKKRVREFWGLKCGICGKSEDENARKLSTHHVNYDKLACCNKSSPLFIALCDSCHSKTNHNYNYWEEMLTNYIMIWFDGESYNPINNEITMGTEQEITA